MPWMLGQWEKRCQATMTTLTSGPLLGAGQKEVPAGSDELLGNPEAVRPLTGDNVECQPCGGDSELESDKAKQKPYGGEEGQRIEEAKPNKGLPCGVKPGKSEVEEHERTHIPFRSWCKHCVFGRAQSHPHYQSDKEECRIPTISWDYFYLGEDKKQEGTPMVAWKDSNSKGYMGYAVPNKGECEYAIRRGAQDVKRILGYNRMSFRGDQEPALRTMMEGIKQLVGEQCTLEDTPAGDSQSNGDVESAINP